MDRRCPQPNPCNQNSSDQDQEKAREVKEILARFQASCGEVMARLENISQPSPQSSGRNRNQSKCPTQESSEKTNLVKPHLEEVLKVVQFGMKPFMGARLQHLQDLSDVLSENKEYIKAGQCFFNRFEPVLARDLETLPQFITMWGAYAKFIQDMYVMGTDPNSPAPNLRAINHCSPYITQNAYTELLRNGVSLCSEVERGLRVIEIMYSKLDETIAETQRRLQEAFSKLCATEGTAETMFCDGQDWIMRFRDLEHSLSSFLEEWQKGGDELNQPRPYLPCPPSIPDLSLPNCDPCSVPPGSGATNMKLNRKASPPRCANPCEESENEKVTKPKLEPKKKESKDKGLELMIQRFNAMNSTLHQEAQQNMGQKEVLNQSLRAMEELPHRQDK